MSRVGLSSASRRRTESATPPPALASARSPSIDIRSSQRGRHVADYTPPTPVSELPEPPDTPPPLESAYVACMAGSVSSHSSRRSTPELSSSSSPTAPTVALHPSSRVFQPHSPEASYSGLHDRKPIAMNYAHGVHSYHRGYPGPDKRDEDNLSSPTESAAHPYNDIDDAPSPSSSAGSQQQPFSQEAGQSCQYRYQSHYAASPGLSQFQAFKQEVPSNDAVSRQPPPTYPSYTASSPTHPLSPLLSQPPSPTYARSPSTTHAAGFTPIDHTTTASLHQDSTVMNTNYSSLSMAGCLSTSTPTSRGNHQIGGHPNSPHSQYPALPSGLAQNYTHMQSVHGESQDPASPHCRFPSVVLAPIQRDHFLRDENSRRSLRRAPSYNTNDQHHHSVSHHNDIQAHDIDNDSRTQSLAAHYPGMHQAQAQLAHRSQAHLPQYAYTYSSPSNTHNSSTAWRSDLPRERSMLVQ
ncbi:hypothetical protein PHLCEN_2v3458 [Hermanssonia centrifuga]|uniref:Uncharacterized protein n=1 Tax=Hermanssonia centrifuga TaxID=98765 RepID=A0A2R6QIL1_9APHY|nr:hypothetical protein PHLCEN_2v3458 [Hermanssonia centrifuga]